LRASRLAWLGLGMKKGLIGNTILHPEVPRVSDLRQPALA
jgi:hypothetical protein